MLKKFTWIAALFVALAMVFAGCTQLGELDDGSGPRAAGNPIVDGAKYLEISTRVNGWDSLDIRAGKAKNLDKFTEDATHTITIYGKTVAGTKGLYLGNTDSDYSTNWGYLSEVEGNGSFTIKATVPWAQIANAGNNKRISIPTPPSSFFLYEVVINDGTKDLYKLSEDKEIQDLEDGDQPFPDDTVILSWWVKAGTPTIKVVAPGAGEKVKVTFDPDGGTFVNPNAKERTVTEGTKIGKLPTVTKGTEFFLGWFDSGDTQFTDASIVTGALTLKAKWGGADSVARVGDTIVHSYPKLTGNSASDGWEFKGTVNADGSAKYTKENDYQGGRTRYTFPLAKLEPLIKAGEEDLFNVVEFTFETTFDDADFASVEEPDYTLGVTLKIPGGGTDISRYPLSAGNAYVDLKEGTTTFKVAISDIAGGSVPGLDLERRNKGPATIKLLKVVYSKGKVFTVTFDGNAQVRATNVEPQKILAEMKASAPTKPNWYDENFVKVTDFLGWYTADGKLFDFANTLIESDIDLVSKWKVAYKRTVTLNLGGGTIASADNDLLVQEFATIITSGGSGSTNPDGDGIVFPDLVTKPTGVGDFIGWFDRTEKPAVKYGDENGDAVTGLELTRDVTITAVWQTTFKVDLSKGVASSQSQADGGFGEPPTATYAASKLSVDFTTGTQGQSSRKAVFIAFTDDQLAVLQNAGDIEVKITFSAAPAASYRVGLANKDSFSGWNSTSLPNLTADATQTFTLTKNGQQPSATWWFMIQMTGGTEETLVIEEIEITG
jgi:hypothetical protein